MKYIVTGSNLCQILKKHLEAEVFRSYQHPLHIIKVAQERGDEIFMKLSSRVSKKRHKTFHSANCCFIIISPHINLDNYFVAVRWETTEDQLKTEDYATKNSNCQKPSHWGPGAGLESFR